MNAWKKALVLGAISSAAILFMKKKYPAGVLATGVGLAVLASEYPEKFEKVRRSLPDYFDRGMQVMEMAAKAGKRITEAAGQRPFDSGHSRNPCPSQTNPSQGCSLGVSVDSQLLAGVGTEAFRGPGRGPNHIYGSI